MDTSFSIEESASYQVFVQSEQTGFANEFSPIYRITAIADQPPLVRWMAPNSTRITASDSQMIPVKVQVQDEFPVDSLVARARMNGGEWEESQLDVRTDDSTISAANTPAFSAAAAWELDVASWSPQAGDILDVELVATDRLGNISRSTLLHVAISTRPTAEGPSSLELLHQQLAIQLEAMVGEMGLAENQLDSLLQRESSAEQNLAEQGVTSTVTSILASLESEESRLQHLLIKAIESTQSFAEEQVLMRVGESLAASQERFASDVDQQLLEPNAQAQSRAVGLLERLRSVQAARERLETISGSFQLLAGFPVMARHARQFVNLAEAHAECKQLMMDPAQSLHRLGRLQALFASQLLDVQQSMRDSIPNMAPDVAHQLQLNASQLGKSIESMERLRSSQNRDAILQAHEMVGFQLAQLSQFSKMAGNLLAEMENAENTIEQLSVSAEEIIGRLFTPQRSPGGTDKQSVERVVAQLAWMRQLHHTADGGSREYAADLGMSQRAVDFWAHEPNSDARELDLKLSEIAEAMGTLHALSYVADARSLLEQLLTSEQWTTTSPDLMVDNPRLWDAFLQRVEQSAKRLRRTEIPVSLIEELQQITSGNLSAQIEKKIVVRRWDSALVSVASEVQALVHELSQIQSQLAVYAAAARRVLQDHTPRISKLARRASQATRHVEEVTKHLAQAVSQEQTANESQQFAQLTADVQELSKPTRDLREALVDLAATQNLLDRRETQLARQADVAIDIVDQAEEMAQTSLSEVDSLAASEMRAEALKNSALLQSQSAAALEHLADHFDQLESQPEVVSDQTLSAQLGELSQLLDDVVAATDTAKPAGSSANESMYEQAAELAGMADSKPQDVLSQLEEELRTNQPMKAELSSIARQAVEDALQRLERAAIEQRTIANALELSDPRVNSLKALSMHDIQVLRDQMSSTLESLINEAKGTAGAGKQIDQERSLADTQTRLRSARDRLTDIALDSPREVLSERFLELRNNLSDSQQRLDSTAEELRRATFIEIHQNGADLSNRRREMRDRQRRIQQEMMRNSQAIERSQQSRLRQIDASLRQSEQHLEELVAQQTSVLARPKAPGPASDNGVNELAKRIDLARAAVQAELEMRTALEQRLTAAKQNLEKINQQELSLLSSANPSVELSSNLTSQAAEVISGMLELLSFWLKMDEDGRSFQMDQSRAAISQLRDSRQREQQVRNSVELASDALARAARHELRLEYQEAGATLNALASEIMWVATDHIERAQKNLDEVLVVDEANSSAEGRATTEKTAAIAQDLAAAEQAIRSAANRVRSLVQGGEPASSDESTGESSHATSATAQAPMDAQQKAQLLDELDQQVHGELSLRDQEDDTQQQDSSNGESSDSAPPNSLTQAAERLAKSMNRSRQPSGEAVANTDLGMATQSQAANVEPQGPAAVRLLDVVRSNSQWGELREQKTDELFETRREYVAPRFREQIQAYFRELAERGQ
jgi:predicted XRE-type DNA-binding protein